MCFPNNIFVHLHTFEPPKYNPQLKIKVQG